jgi:NAD(P)-dependent dehydrogenase (short-subunit alcohol dehydrogenase family)
MQERDPREGPTPSLLNPQQDPPGTEDKLRPEADHGETSYQGCGKLQGLAAVITGGDSGIGRAVALAFAREGADVAFGYIGEEETEDARETRRLVEEAGQRCLAERFDVGDTQACKAFVQRAHDTFGRLDILVNNAAYQMEQQGIEEITHGQLERTFRTNIFGYFFMVQAALPFLKEGAVILNTGSVTAMEGNEGLIDYSATKGAIHTFTKSLAASLAEKGIRVNCVAPGPVWTPLIPATLEPGHVRKFGKDTMWGRPAQPAEIAPSYVFLASADARYYTGEVFAPTGKTTTR